MNVEEYERMFEFEDFYWWFQGRRSIVMNMLEPFLPAESSDEFKILDLGCGTGLISAELKNRGEVVSLDFSHLALEFCQKRSLKNLVQADVQALPLKSKSFDLMLALDMLEHIEDDEHVLREIFRCAKPSGIFFLTVPAFQFFWSEHDDALHHFRRYSMAMLRKKLTESGFTIKRITYAITFMFLPIVFFRLLQRTFKRNQKPKNHLIILPEYMNSMLIKFLEIEAAMLKRFNFPFGVSLVAICERKV